MTAGAPPALPRYLRQWPLPTRKRAPRGLGLDRPTRLLLVRSGRLAGLNWHASFRRGGIVLPGARGGRRLAPVTGEKATIVESADDSGGVRIRAPLADDAHINRLFAALGPADALLVFARDRPS